MAKTVSETTIRRSADEVWATIGGFGDLGWYLGVERCDVSGDVRTVAGARADLEIDERESHRDEDRRTYTFEVVGVRGESVLDLGDGEVVDIASMSGHHRSCITVDPLDDASCRVTIALELDPGHDQMMSISAPTYQRVLDHLREQLEG